MKENISKDFLLNKVDPTTQVQFPYYVEGENKEHAKRRVMFIGNSITIHERKDDIGWFNNWGMAASSLDNDYVHIVYKYLLDQEKDTSICVVNGSSWENDFVSTSKLDVIIDTAKWFKPDLIIVRIGENFSKKLHADGVDSYIGFNYLIKSLKPICDNIHMTSLFWHVDYLDNAIIKVANEYGLKYIQIDDLGKCDENKAIGKFDHPGVQGHPGDLGMKRIAKRIIDSLKNQNR